MKTKKENKFLTESITQLKNKKKVLLLTTSNRWSQSAEIPKSTELAIKIQKELQKFGVKAELIDVTKLNIYPCEGNVSGKNGNDCGPKGAILNDKKKNPSGYHRCWASINNANDELWKVSKALFESDCVVFFASVRWGQLNSYYQKLIERLTWIENRHSTLGEENIVGKIDAGLILIGQNWNGKVALKTQKEVLKFFGFKVNPKLCWEWHYTTPEDETNESYKNAAEEFQKEFLEFLDDWLENHLKTHDAKYAKYFKENKIKAL